MSHWKHRQRSEPQPTLDYSSPEAQAALKDITLFIAEVRNQLYRRTALYERTLGLAVIPVLIRRSLIMLRRRLKRRGRAIQ